MEPEKKLNTLIHDNGLILLVEENIKNIQSTNKGYEINLASKDARQISKIRVNVSEKSISNLANYLEKNINGETFYYKQDVFDGGSGGSEFTLTIWKSFDKRNIKFEHHVQQDNTPDFNVIWSLAKTAKLKKEKH